ncbi:hypothetical protein [Psychromonas sp. SR45-3]|uniref:hypothetical protein n=1 Tax=Psychromonas sp. SR45-3 TaxID=2760930 RepID=UPI0015F7996A|nr:hypothetical protein [Psychromonas sp. SR45-3]MBB1274131.1 hypothetical protein [Psychromonas sp. SR45-3]
MNPNEQYFNMAMCYIEIGKITSKRNWIWDRLPKWFPIGKVTPFSDVGDYQNANAYQLFHAIELYLKYAILNKEDKCWGHDVTNLYDKYTELYPSEDFHFEHPFDFSNYEVIPENIGEKELAEAHMAQFKISIMDQHLRYPSDNKTGGYSFSLSSCYFKEIEQKFMELHSKINNA